MNDVHTLTALAAGLCQDARVGIELSTGGWAWQPERRVILVPRAEVEGQGSAYCAGIIAHEVGHSLISRYLDFPVRFESAPAGRFLLNALEDPRVDRWMARRYPGVAAWRAESLRGSVDGELPGFLRFCFEAVLESARGFEPDTSVPEPVATALQATRDARRAYAACAPPTDLHAPVGEHERARYEDEVAPALLHQGRRPSLGEQRIRASALDAIRIAEREVFPVVAELWRADREQIERWLLGAEERCRSARGTFHAGGALTLVKRALAEGGPDRTASPQFQRLAARLLAAALEAAVPAPLITTRGARGHREPRRDRVPPRPAKWEGALTYDEALAQVAGQVDALTRRLEEVLRPRRRLRERAGHRSGSRVDMRRLIAFEADPRRADEIWRRRTVPDRRRTSFGLLVDLSGSMRGPKSDAALLGVVLLAETLARLDVPFAVDGFQDVLIPLHAIGAPLDAAARRTLAELPLEIEGCRPGGNNGPDHNDDGPCLLEAAERLLAAPADARVLIAVSDGRPEGLHSTEADLTAAVSDLTSAVSGLELIGLGLGEGTSHVEEFYPNATGDIPLDRLAETIGGLIEAALLS